MLHLLIDLFLLTNAYIISKLVFFPFNEGPLSPFDLIEWLVLITATSVGLVLTRTAESFPYNISLLKSVLPKLFIIIFLGELLRFGLNFVSSVAESIFFGVCFFASLVTYRVFYSPGKNSGLSPPRVLLFGAGEAGEDYLKNQRQKGHLKYIYGILDDDLNKKGELIEGIPVLGNFEDCLSYIYSLEINEIIICVETISSTRLGKIIDKIDVERVKIKIIPALKETLNHQKQIASARNVNAEDLLGRNPIVLNNELIKDSFKDKKIFITGAGGSIGSELCHQLLSYPIKELICISRSEFSLYQLQEKLSEENTLSLRVEYLLGNIRDVHSLDSLFREFKPDIIFHAAAHKHLPYMEAQEREAIKNNVIGTENVLKASKKYRAEKFILISTDKAVNPSNVMGASKRLAEMLTEAYFEREELNTAIVRFGNVLGSKGSVVPLFRKQILRGGPITITDPKVVRYFMTIPEAALLVINCGALAKGGEKFILDMGKPIRINDLVRKLIRLYGFSPDQDIAIKYTGLRPGEKLVEELLTKSENLEKTINEKIFVSKSSHPVSDEDLDTLAELKSKIHQLTGSEVRGYLKKILPEFKGDDQG